MSEKRVSYTKAMWVDDTAARCGITKRDARLILFQAIKALREGLLIHGRAPVKDLGTFNMKWAKGRVGRNPRTGEAIEISARYQVKFTPSKSLKEAAKKVEEGECELFVETEPEPEADPEPVEDID